MKKIIYLIYILIGCSCLFACKKEDEEVHPEITTLEAIPTSSSSCLFKGSIINKGNIPVLDYGFVYSNSESVNISWGGKVSLGKDVPVGIFEKEVSGLFMNNYGGSDIYVKAYITNEKGTVYGQAKRFSLPSINFQGVSPVAGKAGDRITITGNNFNTKANNIEVRFNNTAAKIVEITTTKIVVEVPANVSGYYYNEVPIYVMMGGQSLTAFSNFKITPNVKDFSPKTGTFNTSVTITGDNLPPSGYYSNVSVSFGGVNAYISSINSTSITVIVPNTVTSENLKVAVTVDGQTTQLPGEFNIEAPTISSFSTYSGLAGTSFIINGTNFNGDYGYYYHHNVVKIGETQAIVNNASSTGITVTIPSDLSPGDYKVSVFTGVHTVTSTETFTVTNPAITSFSPASGTSGTEVIINGLFNPSNFNNVAFGTTHTYAYEVSANTVKATVPSGLSPGKMKISVTTNGQTVTSVDDFAVLAPTITSFSPSSGVPGTHVVITGTGFSPVKSYNAVKFGTVETTIIQASTTSITAVVPSNVSAGAMKISVVVNGQTAVSEANFTVSN